MVDREQITENYQRDGVVRLRKLVPEELVEEIRTELVQ